MKVVQIGSTSTGATVPISDGTSGPTVVAVTGTTGGVSPADLSEAIAEHRADPEAHSPLYAKTTDLTAHIEAPEPHPVYDDLPSLTLLFENGLV